MCLAHFSEYCYFYDMNRKPYRRKRVDNFSNTPDRCRIAAIIRKQGVGFRHLFT